ncbi:hypothetical protein BH20VER3_BH20VER3_12000 [soil metagenome]
MSEAVMYLIHLRKRMNLRFAGETAEGRGENYSIIVALERSSSVLSKGSCLLFGSLPDSLERVSLVTEQVSPVQSHLVPQS